MTKDEMKEAILTRLQRYPGTSFAELDRIFPDFHGDKMYVSDKDDNIVFWAGMSVTACEAIRELQADKKVRLEAVSFLVYLGDGAALSLPMVGKPPRNGYKKLHWLPTVLHLKRQRSVAA